MTGFSGSGKSTVAKHVYGLLVDAGVRAYIVDGDDLREGLNSDLGFSREDRTENVRRVGEVALILARAGLVNLVPVISPYAASRELVRARHADAGIPFFEVHVATSLATCEGRDPKGLYAKARRGEIPMFTGVSDPYEAPVAPDLALATENESPADSAQHVVALLEARGVLERSRL